MNSKVSKRRDTGFTPHPQIPIYLYLFYSLPFLSSFFLFLKSTTFKGCNLEPETFKKKYINYNNNENQSVSLSVSCIIHSSTSVIFNCFFNC